MKGFCPNPNAIWAGENYLICYKTSIGDEHIIQSDSTPDRAQHSVDVLNEHERLNARKEAYYWRIRLPGEIQNGKRLYA